MTARRRLDKGDYVPGIQSFTCSLATDKKDLKCQICRLPGERGEIQLAFAAYLVQRGFDIVWADERSGYKHDHTPLYMPMSIPGAGSDRYAPPFWPPHNAPSWTNSTILC